MKRQEEMRGRKDAGSCRRALVAWCLWEVVAEDYAQQFLKMENIDFAGDIAGSCSGSKVVAQLNLNAVFRMGSDSAASSLC